MTAQVTTVTTKVVLREDGMIEVSLPEGIFLEFTPEMAADFGKALIQQSMRASGQIGGIYFIPNSREERGGPISGRLEERHE